MDDHHYNNNNHYSDDHHGGSGSSGGLPVWNDDVGSSVPTVEELRASAEFRASSGSLSLPSPPSSPPSAIMQAEDGDHYNDNGVGPDGNSQHSGQHDLALLQEQAPGGTIDSHDATSAVATSSDRGVTASKWRFRLYATLAMAVLILFIVLMTIGAKNKKSSGGGRPSQEQIQIFLTQRGISSAQDLQNPTSPQARAVAWLAESDGLPPSLPDGSIYSDQATYLYLTRYIMALNYYALNGPEWNLQYNFMSDLPICSWNSVAGGIFCTNDNIPYWFELDHSNLKGSIPTENGLLWTVLVMYMSYNNLEGSIPTELCHMSHLQLMTLDNNNITGTIPECLGALTDMTVFSVSNNAMNGMIPDSLCMWKVVEGFYAGYNHFTGPLPDCLGDWSSVKEVLVSDNKLTGSLPDLSGMVNLVALAIDDNHIEGDIINLNTLSKLQILYAEDNKLEGDLITFGVDMDDLFQVDVSNNNLEISGDDGIPPHLFQKRNLTVLDLSRNNLEGTFPTEIPVNGSCSLWFLSVYDNRLTGPIPTQISLMKNLFHLDLSGNNLSMAIPTEIGTMTGLSYLFLGNLPDLETGPIPDTFAGLTNLQQLSLKNSHRNGTIPTFLGTMSGLTLLDLDDNGFTGSVPTELGNLRALQYLLLSRNTDLNGSVPVELADLTEVDYFFLEGTGLSGNISFLCDLPPLYGLDGNTIKRNIVADCAGNTSVIDCLCCACCNPSLESKCPVPELEDKDLQWEQQFFGNNSTTYNFGVDLSGLMPGSN